MDKCPEALARRSVPYSTGKFFFVSLLVFKPLVYEGGGGKNLHEPIGRTAHDQCTVSAKIDAGNRITVSRQAPHQSPGSDIPQEHGLIVRPAGQYVSLGREGQAVYVVVVASQRGRVPPRGGRLPRRRLGPARHPVPQADGLVVGSARQYVAVGCPGQAAHARHVADERVHVGARGGVPELDGAVGGC